ncbi:MAG: carboxylate-amine ligase [Steroidobacteraceae bacterium]
MPAEFTFGIEEEFFIGHRRSRNVAIRLPERLIKRAERELGDRVTHELLQCQLELVSPVLDSIDAARSHVYDSRRRLAHIAARQDMSLIAAGTHPLAAWVEQEITDDPRYDDVFKGFQILGRRNLFCGLHIHVAVPDGVDRVHVMNRAMRWLPLFLALSTSSPFWHRQRTGLLSYRQAAYDEWPRSGIPDFFANEAQYAEFASRLVSGGAMKDASFLWWAIRPSLRYPTLELRIADACTNAADTIALAALYRALIAFLVRNPDFASDWSPITRRVIDENRWRAKRYGTSAEFIDDRTGDAVPIGRVLQELCELVREDADRLGCTPTFRQLSAVLRNGTSAHRQLEIFITKRQAGVGRTEALKAVVDWLAEHSVPAIEPQPDTVSS